MSNQITTLIGSLSWTDFPSEIIKCIFSHILDPCDWIKCMRTCKSLYDTIIPIYYDTNFHVIYIQKDKIPKCLREKYDKCQNFSMCMVVDPKLVYTHFMLEDCYTSPIYLVKGLFLPFLKFKIENKSPNSIFARSSITKELHFSHGRFAEHYSINYPIQNQQLLQLVQNISRVTKKYTKINVNYYQLLLFEFETYYSNNLHLKTSSKYDKDKITIDEFKKYPFAKGFHEMILLRHYFAHNNKKTCFFCGENHSKLL